MKRNKKAQSLNQEIILIVVVLIAVGFTLFFNTKYTFDATKKVYECAPNLTYQFPAVFTYTFLMTQIKDEDIESLSLDKNKIYYVKDLLKLSEDVIKDTVNQYRKNYIDEHTAPVGEKNLYEYYELFSENDIDTDNLLKIEYGTENLPDLEYEIEQNSYCFYLKNFEGKYTVIYFKESS